MVQFELLHSKIKPLLTDLPLFFKATARQWSLNSSINFNQYMILEMIQDSGMITLSELGKKLFVDQSTVTRLIDPLNKKELVGKYKAEGDARSVYVSVTQQGKSVLLDFRKESMTAINYLLQKVPAGKQDQLLEALNTIRVLLKENLSELENLD